MSKVTELETTKKNIKNLTSEKLNACLGKDIKDICDKGYTDPKINHCAHFVSHVLDLKVGLVCGSMKYATRGEGTSLRVNEIYNACSSTGAWSNRPISNTHCLIFATLPSNIKNGEMQNHPRKHIGVYINGTAWHYSNRGDKVVTDSAESFLIKFRGVYGKDTLTYYGAL